MTRIAVALAVFAGGIVAATHDSPVVVTPSAAASSGKHRPTASLPRASRSVQERLPLTKPMVSPRTVQPSRKPSVGGASAHNWNAVAACESSGDWHIYSPPYFGGVQMDMTFWVNYGGRAFASRPDLATREQQIVVAERGLAVQGAGAWPVCGFHLQDAA